MTGPWQDLMPKPASERWHPKRERDAVSKNTGAINDVEMECVHVGRSTIQRVKQ